MSVGVLFLARYLPFQLFGVAFQIVVWSLIGGIAISAVLTSCYVVIRYPYISLVSTSDEDTFAKQYASPRLLLVAKVVFTLGLFVFCLLSTNAALNADGFRIDRVAVMLYFFIQFFFTLFLCFWYQPVTHPTIATFIRSTLGIGLVVVPLVLPILLIGSIRCRHLLAAASLASSQDAARKTENRNREVLVDPHTNRNEG